MRFVWSAVMLAVCAAPAFAAGGEDDEKSKKASDPLERIDRLEKELKALREENEAKKAGLPTSLKLEEQDKKDAPKPEVDFKASFTDGFHIKSTDGAFDLHVGGRWEEEYRYTFNRDVQGATRTSVNTFYAREAFITMDGTLFKNWGFKINGDFSQPQTGSTAGATVATGAIMEEYWVEWKEFKEFRLLFGSFKQPCSFEITDSPRFAALIQRSPMARFMPNFDTGIKAYGSLFDTAFTYELAVTNGRSHTANAGRDNNDDNDGKEYAARLTTAPFVGDKDSFLKGLRLGVYGTFAHEGQGNPLTGTQPTGWPGGIATNELAVTYLTGIPATFHFHGDRYRVGGEGTYAYGPFMVRGEVFQRSDEVFTNGGKNNLLMTPGYYAEAAFVLTGEDRIPNARLVPRRPFSIADGGFGALEVVTRWGVVAMDRKTLVDDGVAIGNGLNSNRARSFTLGFNWWPVQNVRFSLDYIGEDYGLTIPLSAGHIASHANGVLARFQVDF